MASFGTVQLQNNNALLPLFTGQATANVNATEAQTAGALIKNRLADATFDDTVGLSHEDLQKAQLQNQFATQKNPLEITGLRQSLGLDPNPNLDRLLSLYRDGGGAAGGGASPPATGDQSELIPGLGSRESGNDPSKVNSGGYSGMFQQGTARLADVGVYTPAQGEDLKEQLGWTFNIPGFPDVKSHEDFLASPGAQRAALAAEVANTDKSIAATPGAEKMNANGLRAVAHLGGVAGMQRFVSSGGLYNPADSNGTRLSDYYTKFAQGGVPALQQAFGHPDGPPGAAQPQQVAAAPGVTVAPDGAVPPAAAPPVQTASRGTMPGQPMTDAVPGAPVAASGTQGVDDVMTRLRAAQPQPDPSQQPPVAPAQPAAGPQPNTLADVGAPAAPQQPPAQPQSQPQLMPAASAQPPAQAAPASGTGMQSAQVQQAQQLLRQATQIELAASATPNDPRTKAAAAAMVADLRGRAGVLMQADSVTVGPNGVQTHSLTGKQDSAATPAMDYKPDPNNPGVLVSPGQKPVVLPPGRATTLANGQTWVNGPGGTFKKVKDADLEGATAAEAAAAGGKLAAQLASKTQESLIPLARTSTQAISNIDYGLNQLNEAAKGGLPGGYFAESLAKSAAMAKYLGIKIPGIAEAVANLQVASKTLAVVSGAILQNILGSGSAITEGKIEAFIHAQPGIVNDPDATKRILNWARSQFTYDHEMAMDGLKNVDPGSGRLPPSWQAAYITKHGAGPVYDSISGEMKQPDGQEPAREPPGPATAPAAPKVRPPLTSFHK